MPNIKARRNYMNYADSDEEMVVFCGIIENIAKDIDERYYSVSYVFMLECLEEVLELCGIKYHRIGVATPRHNGKVERQHRTDEKRFYKKMKMYNLADGRK